MVTRQAGRTACIFLVCPAKDLVTLDATRAERHISIVLLRSERKLLLIAVPHEKVIVGNIRHEQNRIPGVDD